MRCCVLLVLAVFALGTSPMAFATQIPSKKEAVGYAKKREKTVCNQDKSGSHDWIKAHKCSRPASGLSYKSPACEQMINARLAKLPKFECYISWFADRKSFFCLGTLTVSKRQGKLAGHLKMQGCNKTEG
jgi:hypothetical protein